MIKLTFQKKDIIYRIQSNIEKLDFLMKKKINLNYDNNNPRIGFYFHKIYKKKYFSIKIMKVQLN